MKKKGSIWSVVSVVCLLLGIFSLTRAFSGLTHHTASGKSLALHIGSAVLWFVISFLISRRQKKEGVGEIPPSELASSIQKKLAIPYKLLPDKVPPDALMRFFRRTAKEIRGQGFTPVLVPVDEALDRWLDTAEKPSDSGGEADLSAPPENGKAILERRWQEAFASEAETPEVPQTVLGEITGGKEQVHFLSCQTEDGASRETLMLRLPTGEAWRAVSWIPVGGSRGMPDNDEVLAVCKYWYDKYKAAPAAIGYGTLEFILPKVIDQEEAMAVAKEHFAFCPDRVRRDTESGTIGEVADCLWQSTLWHFRWYEED